MVNRKFFGIILLTFSLLGLAGFALTTGNTPSSGTPEEEILVNIPSSYADQVPQGVFLEVKTGSQATGSTFSGEVEFCTNKSDFEQVIDLKIINLAEDNILVNIDYPFSRTVNLSQNQIKVLFGLPLPYGVTSVDLSSNDETLTLQVPPCVVRGGDSSGISQSSFSSGSKGDSQQPPPPVPELSTMALTGIGVFSLIFIISRSK